MSTDQQSSLLSEQEVGMLPRAQLLAGNLQAVLQRINSVAHSPNLVRAISPRSLFQ